MSQREILKSSGRNKELNPEEMSKVEICRSEIIIRAKHKSTKQHEGTILAFTFFALLRSSPQQENTSMIS